jgi:hypothetical protein
MSRTTDAGKAIMVKALAQALCGGTYATLDGDGRLMGTAPLPEKFEQCDHRGFRFGKTAEGRYSSGGEAAMFLLYPPGDIAVTPALVGGTIGRALGKGVDAAMDDQTVYAGMLLEVDEITYELRLGDQRE